MKKCLIIINPSSGKHILQNKLDKIIGQLVLRNIVDKFDIFYTEKKNDAYEKAKNADETQYDFMMSVGGDGTLNEVISGMADSHKKIPLCILAAGTVNDFANYLGIPTSVNKIVDMIEDFYVIPSDVGKLNDSYFINVAAGGMFTDISFVVTKEDKKKYGHPTIKPLERIKDYIINSSQAGEIILDPFVGSGTTCVAAKRLGRKYIGFEINEKYYKIAKDRLQGWNQKNEMNLFDI